MAGARILFPEFRDEQSTSRYPFADTATLQSSTDASIQIAADTFIDASFFAIGGSTRAFISSISVAAQKITITVGDSDLAARISASYDPLSPPADGIITFNDTYGRPAGMLLSTPVALARFSAWAIGTYTFTQAETEFVSSVVIPANEPGVRALRPETKQFLTGDVWLVGDQGVVLRQDGPGVIRVDIVGVPLFKRFLCEPQSEDFPTKRYIKTINGCGPDEFGNFTFTATNQLAPDAVLRIYVDGDTIVIDTVGRSVV
ncbi:MAG: hypothetical protein EBT15_04770 [Betaproteobacteria bacterium]|nr:hypothetical protein [Betaproteobacteria bacterium]